MELPIMHSFQRVALAALAMGLLLMDCTGEAAKCADVDFLKVPVTIKKASSYSARKILPETWKAYMDAVDCIGKREGAFCPFVTRMLFHDAAAVDQDQPPNGSGDDGTVLTSYLEGISFPNTQYGEAPTVRYLLKKIIKRFDLSFADGLALAAVVCTNTMGSDVSIQDVCVKNQTPFFVGKLDGVVPFDNVKFDLPSAFMPFDTFSPFWLGNMNNLQTVDKWRFNISDAAALMGSHALNVPHGCTKGLSGQRNRVFDNSYYKDMLSGDVSVVLSQSECPSCPGVVPGESNGCKFSTDGIRTRNAAIRRQVTQAQDANPDVPRLVPLPFPAGVWIPDAATRAPCTGKQCQCCSADDVKSGSSRPFCAGRKEGECFWPYTQNDAFMAQGVRQNRDPDLLKAYQLFRDNLGAWREAYAVGLCKLSHVGARFGTDGAVDLSKKVGNYIGKCENLGPTDAAVLDSLFTLPC